MKQVILKGIAISNFKGIKALEVNFNGEKTTITGKNGAGKSTIYNAYLWCLFGKNQDGTTMSVQPRDTDNNIIHKLDNEVQVTLLVNGEEIKIKRVQREDWQVPKGKTEEVFKGNLVERFYNDVPCSVREFQEKLDAICSTEDWYLLSSISAFMSIKQEDRRKKLIAIADDTKEAELLEQYPRVKQAIAEGKTVDEYLKQTKYSIKKMQDELDMIPARIDQQSKLIIEKDFNVLDMQAQKVNKEIDELDKSMLGIDRSEEKKQLQKNLESIQNDMNDIVSKCQQDKIRKENELKRRITTIEEDIKTANEEISSLEKKKATYEAESKVYDTAFKEYQSDWMEKNKEEFDEEITKVCHFCGTELPLSKIAEMQDKALKEFNKQKVDELNKILKKAQDAKNEKNESEDKVKDCETKIAEKNTTINQLEKEGKAKNTELNSLASVDEMVAEDRSYQALKAQEKEVKAKIDACTNADNEDKLNELRLKREELREKALEINTQLNQKKVNEMCQQLINELEEKSREYSNAISQYTGIEQEIKDYKKAMITATEENVSKYFEMVRWKMYEPNISNDGEKEVCQAIIDGKEYSEQNTATKVNAGIDIINGLSKALGISVPLFVDNTECVNEVLEIPSQMVLLQVSRDLLTINN